MISVYTDASCFPKKIGYNAYIVYHNNQPIYYYRSRPTQGTCNNQEELKAIISAMRFLNSLGLDQPTEIFTDSMYVINGITGNKKAFKSLWTEFFKHYKPAKIKLTWVKAHADDELNKMVDKLAKFGDVRLAQPTLKIEDV